MSLDLNVLRALLRLSASSSRAPKGRSTRRRGPATQPTVAALLDRVEADETSLEAALERLVAAGLVLRAATGPRLTMIGLAVAASTIPAVGGSKKPRTAAAPKRTARIATVHPLVRRHRAA